MPPQIRILNCESMVTEAMTSKHRQLRGFRRHEWPGRSVNRAGRESFGGATGVEAPIMLAQSLWSLKPNCYSRTHSA